ncbi:MAG: MBL fold metallo-hydrolase [Ruminococcaceae bacterium]|nr:MBL fold metallo-hydrolase [Oscillospiraceae bacterium]
MKIVSVIICIAAILVCVAAVLYMFMPSETEFVPNGTDSGSGLSVHFIDVGQADATLILCDGKSMLIDGGNKGDSDLIYTYLEKNGIEYLDYVVGTHAHEDHMGGLPGAFHFADVGNVLCPVTDDDTKFFSDFKKSVEAKGLEIVVPSPKDTFSLGNANIEVLACNCGKDTNNTSIALKLEYGEVSFLFMGDAEAEVEEYIIENGFDINTTVLKAGHHGSSSSTSNYFLHLADPDFAVISCGKGNSYGHPHDETVEKLREFDVTMYRTDILGDIICTSDGKTVSFVTSKGESQKNFVLNTHNKKFHLPECDGAKTISDKNRKEYKGTLRSLCENGYIPCGRCG